MNKVPNPRFSTLTVYFMSSSGLKNGPIYGRPGKIITVLDGGVLVKKKLVTDISLARRIMGIDPLGDVVDLQGQCTIPIMINGVTDFLSRVESHLLVDYSSMVYRLSDISVPSLEVYENNLNLGVNSTYLVFL